MTAPDGIPQQIGSYRILRKLGEGGMGAVYEAIHDAIQRRVAVKLLHAELARDAEFVGRFFNEARAVNLIGHAGLVQVSDLGQLPDGSAYLVMELLRGESLAQRLEKTGHQLPLADVLQFSWQIADSLSATHAKGIIHRDLKPQNVMLVADSHVAIGERTKLLDFGLAKVSEEAGGVRVKTNTNAVMGTPLYMSPEQCDGAGKLDGKTDVYALGVMMYEMLCGRLPFEAEGHGRVMLMHMTATPEPLRNRNPSIPKPVAALVHKLLAKDKDDRPTMRELAGQIEALFPLAPASKREIPVYEDKTTAPDAVPAGIGHQSTLGPVAEQTRGGTGRLTRPGLLVLSGVLLMVLCTLAVLLLSRPRPAASLPSGALHVGFDAGVAVPTPPGIPATANKTPSVTQAEDPTATAASKNGGKPASKGMAIPKATTKGKSSKASAASPPARTPNVRPIED